MDLSIVNNVGVMDCFWKHTGKLTREEFLEDGTLIMTSGERILRKNKWKFDDGEILYIASKWPEFLITYPNHYVINKGEYFEILDPRIVKLFVGAKFSCRVEFKLPVFEKKYRMIYLKQKNLLYSAVNWSDEEEIKLALLYEKPIPKSDLVYSVIAKTDPIKLFSISDIQRRHVYLAVCSGFRCVFDHYQNVNPKLVNYIIKQYLKPEKVNYIRGTNCDVLIKYL